MAWVPLKAVYIAQPRTIANPDTWSVRPSSVRRTWRNRARNRVTAPGLCGGSYARIACKRHEFRRFGSRSHAKGAKSGGQGLPHRGNRQVRRVVDVGRREAKEGDAGVDEAVLPAVVLEETVAVIDAVVLEAEALVPVIEVEAGDDAM